LILFARSSPLCSIQVAIGISLEATKFEILSVRISDSTRATHFDERHICNSKPNDRSTLSARPGRNSSNAIVNHQKVQSKANSQHFRTFYPFHDVMPNPIFRDFDGCVDYLTTGSRSLLA